MPAVPPAAARRSVVPAGAARSLWRSAAWTGAAGAGLCAIMAIAAVAVLWLPASGRSGNAGSALRAGVLTFLASLHAGITVGGVAAGFVPLGTTLLVAAVMWRAGAALADVAGELEVTEPGVLLRAALLQAGSFAAACGVGAAFSTLGTSHVRVFGATVAGFVLCLVSAGVALARWSPLGTDLAGRLPGAATTAARGAVAVLAVYLTAGALLTAAALVVHHDRVELLSRQVGGGWSGLPILVLGVLAAPNAAISAVGYLAGPGFSVGTGSAVDVTTGAHGLLPAFPLLGAVPVGSAGWPAWTLAIATPLLAGVGVGAVVAPAGAWPARCRDALVSAFLAGAILAILAWQGGGALGTGRLATFGSSPLQVGLAVAIQVVLATAMALAFRAGVDAVRGRRCVAEEDEKGALRSAISVFRDELRGDRRDAVRPATDERSSGTDKLAG